MNYTNHFFKVIAVTKKLRGNNVDMISWEANVCNFMCTEISICNTSLLSYFQSLYKEVCERAMKLNISNWLGEANMENFNSTDYTSAMNVLNGSMADNVSRRQFLSQQAQSQVPVDASQ